jgi:hypothetical protein
VLVLAGAEHEVLDGFSWVFALVEDQLHLLGDGHLDAAAAGEAEGGTGGEDAFSDFAAETFQNFRELAALAQRLADGAVAAERAGAGEDQVADTGETGESFTAASAGDGEPGDLRNAAGDEGGGGVVAEADSGGDAGGDGDDVLERAAQLDTDDIRGRVEAEGFRGELLLDAGGDVAVAKGDGYGGGLGLGDFKGEAGAGEGADGEGRD